MILIENLLGILQIEIVIGDLSPWEIQHELDVVVLYAVVRRARIISLQLCHLLLEDLLHRCRPKLLLSLCTKLRKLFDIIHSKLFLDGLELIIEIVLPLLLVDLSLHLLIDLLLDLLKFHLGLEDRKELHRPCPEITELKKVDLIHKILDFNRCSDEVHEKLEIIYAFESCCSLAGNESRRLDDHRRLLLEGLRYHSDLCVLLRHKVVQIPHPSEQVWIVFGDILDFKTLVSLKNRSYGSVRHLKCLHDLGNRTVTVKVLLSRILHRKIVLGNCAYECVIAFSIFYQSYRLLPSDCDRIHSTRKYHRISQRKNRQVIRQLSLINLHHAVSLHHRYYAHFRSRWRHHIIKNIFHHIQLPIIFL